MFITPKCITKSILLEDVMITINDYILYFTYFFDYIVVYVKIIILIFVQVNL